MSDQGGEDHLVALPRVHKTQTALTFVQLAIPLTDVALDAAVLKQVPIAARYALNGLIHGTLALGFRTRREMAIRREQDKCQLNYGA